MKLTYFIIVLVVMMLNSCSKVRDSAGVTRKSIDEFEVIENPPLIIPPDFNLLPPDQLEEKNIDNIEKELAEEILFGLDENEIQTVKQLSIMNQILSKADASEVNSSIREEIDQEFAQEIKTDGIFQINWENEVEVLDAIKESERIRNKNFKGETIAEGEVPIKKEKIKIKKKKRFFFF
ncbi:DUF3035 domain-containing protein [Alphaproteobacteria bacterium]|nr:DUF3035 domain-containing protein [Alphaproteobacteria bacterium]